MGLSGPRLLQLGSRALSRRTHQHIVATRIPAPGVHARCLSFTIEVCPVLFYCSDVVLTHVCVTQSLFKRSSEIQLPPTTSLQERKVLSRQTHPRRKPSLCHQLRRDARSSWSSASIRIVSGSSKWCGETMIRSSECYLLPSPTRLTWKCRPQKARQQCSLWYVLLFLILITLFIFPGPTFTPQPLHPSALL